MTQEKLERYGIPGGPAGEIMDAIEALTTATAARNLDALLAANDLESAQTLVDDTTGSIKHKLQRTLDKAKHSVAVLERREEALRQHGAAEQELREAKQELENAEAGKVKAQVARDRATVELENVRSKHDNVKESLQSASSELQSAKGQLEQTRRELATGKAEHKDGLQEKVVRAEERVNSRAREEKERAAELEAVKGLLVEAQSAASEAETEVAAAESAGSNARDAVERAQSGLRAAKKRGNIKELRQQVAALRKAQAREKTWWGRYWRKAREPLTPAWVSALVAALGLLGGVSYELYSWYMGSVEFQAVEAIRSARQKGPTLYVPRVVEKELANFMGKKQSKYLVLSGPRGCGKSTVMQHAVQDKRSVITVQVHKSLHAATLFELILRRAGVDIDLAQSVRTAGDMGQLLLAAVEREKAQNPATAPDFVPSIVIEAGRGLGDHTIKSLARDAKDLTDQGCASVALVLSDASAAFALPEDPHRQQFLWLDDLTQEESNQLLDVHVCLVGDQKKRNELFDGLGTRPAALIRAAGHLKSGKSVETLVNECKSDAMRALQVMRNSHFSNLSEPDLPDGEDFSELIEALATAPGHSVLVHSLATSRPKLDNHQRVSRTQIREGGSHIVIYHPPTKSYRFYSRSHLLAALELDSNAGGRIHS